MNQNRSENDNMGSLQYNTTPSFVTEQGHILSKSLNPGLKLQYTRTLPREQRLRAELYGSFGNNDYDIIFIDHMMPDMDGVDTVKALIATGRKIPPIVALTANRYEGIREECVQKGFADYLQKPINFKELSKVRNKIFGKDN